MMAVYPDDGAANVDIDVSAGPAAGVEHCSVGSERAV
jgi:hypothetical protein